MPEQGGLIVPNVNSVVQAKSIIEWCKFDALRIDTLFICKSAREILGGEGDEITINHFHIQLF